MEIMGIQSPTNGQQFPLGSDITVIAPCVVNGGNWQVKLTYAKMVQPAPLVVDFGTYKVLIQPTGEYPSEGAGMATNVFRPTTKGKFLIVASAREEATGMLYIAQVEIEVV